MNIWRSIAGMLDIELTSAEPEAALSAINGLGIEISRVQKVNELTYHIRILRRDYPRLDRLCTARGETLRIRKRRGIFWVGRSLTARPVLLLGLCFLLLLVLYLPTRVFFIRVEGNHSVPSRKIVEAAEESGICFGASRREVRSEKMKNALLAAVPELQWAGVNTAGCVAVISVRERTDVQQEPQTQAVTSIIADRDGYILSATATHGNLLVQPGQTVTAGQVLISGYTDCGICIQATRSEGEIQAQTNRELDAVTPSGWAARGPVGDVKRKYSLLFRKKRINLWKDSGISDTSCGRMYEEYDITLPGGFRLPIALCVESYVFYETRWQEWDPLAVEESLHRFAENYVTGQMVAGTVQEKTGTVTLEEGFYHLHGKYVCTEMIGRERREQIGDTNGKIG